MHTHACACTSTTVINSQDVRYHWQKKRRKIQKVACARNLSDFSTETDNQTVLIDHHWHVLAKLNVGSYKLHLQAV